MSEQLLVERMVLGPFNSRELALQAVKDWVKESGESYYAHGITQAHGGGLWKAEIFYFPDL